MKRIRETIFHFNIDWEPNMDNLESAVENTKVSKSHLCYRIGQVYERKTIKENTH